MGQHVQVANIQALGLKALIESIPAAESEEWRSVPEVRLTALKQWYDRVAEVSMRTILQAAEVHANNVHIQQHVCTLARIFGRSLGSAGCFARNSGLEVLVLALRHHAMSSAAIALANYPLSGQGCAVVQSGAIAAVVRAVADNMQNVQMVERGCELLSNLAGISIGRCEQPCFVRNVVEGRGYIVIHNAMAIHQTHEGIQRFCVSALALGGLCSHSHFELDRDHLELVQAAVGRFPHND
eukprot:1409494-Rhodomonas_salina.1